jgi:hypothetical protein
MYCIIPMTVLTSTYSYGFDVLVKAQVTAHNVNGDSVASTANTIGANTRRVPDQMSIPVLVSYSDTSISISWAALIAPATGNSAITAYNLQWDSGTGTFVDLATSLVNVYTVNGLTGGNTY